MSELPLEPEQNLSSYKPDKSHIPNKNFLRRNSKLVYLLLISGMVLVVIAGLMRFFLSESLHTGNSNRISADKPTQSPSKPDETEEDKIDKIVSNILNAPDLREIPDIKKPQTLKTFDDPDFPFTFQYARSAGIFYPADKSKSFTIQNPKDPPYEMSGGYVSYVFQVHDSAGRTLHEYAEQRIAELKRSNATVIKDIHETIANGLTVLSFLTGDGGFGYITNTVLIEAPDKKLIVRIEETNAGGGIETLQPIIATFRFTTPASK